MARITDKVRNWDEAVNKKDKSLNFPLDKNFKTHKIKPAKFIGLFGGTGSGKTNYACEFLSRKNDAFTEIILCTALFGDEDKYKMLKREIPEMVIIDNPDKFPKLENYREEDTIERLIIFDDTIKLSKKQQDELEKWFMAGRKKGFTGLYMAQDYFKAPSFIRRQLNYIVLFNLNDEDLAKRILKKFPCGYRIDDLLDIYRDYTQNHNFITIDVGDNDIRSNFIGRIE